MNREANTVISMKTVHSYQAIALLAIAMLSETSRQVFIVSSFVPGRKWR